MRYKNILITGGAGFVGSHICFKLRKEYPNANIVVLDNLYRKGSALNVPRLEKEDITFFKGDIRHKADLESLKEVDLLIECSAEPSVMAGVTSSPEYVLDTNLSGAINCFELARKKKADIVFVSTSRVYPYEKLNDLEYLEKDTRYEWRENQAELGVSREGIGENFSTNGVKTFYGTSKICAEFVLEEYIRNYQIKGVINRCGIIAGPWQMGKVDQGVVVFWMAQHIFKRPISYIGFGGGGKQVRDVVDIDDLFELLKIQIENIEQYSGQVYNVGGGLENSFSLLELTDYCAKITGNDIEIKRVSETRPGDVRIYISDALKIQKQSGWKPKKKLEQTLQDIYRWIMDNKDDLEKIL